MSDSMPMMSNLTSVESAGGAAGLAGQNTSAAGAQTVDSSAMFPALFNAQLEAASRSPSQFPTELLRIDPEKTELTTDSGNALPASSAMLGLPLMIPATENPSAQAITPPAGDKLFKGPVNAPLGLTPDIANKTAAALPNVGADKPMTTTGETTGQSNAFSAQLGLSQDKQLLMQMGNRAADVLPSELTTLQSTSAGGMESLTQNQSSQGLSQSQHSLAAITGLATGIQATGKTDVMPAPITVPPQHPNWNSAVGERVQWMIGNNLQQADIRLDPPELGSLEVRIQVSRDQTHVIFSAPNQQVRDVLEAEMPRLREMFNNMGLSLGDVGVSQESFKQSQETGEQSAPVNSNSLAAADEEAIEEGGIRRTITTGSGLVDTYA